MEPNPVVVVLRKSFIRPPTPTKRGHLFLSCLDIFWRRSVCHRRVIFYKPGPQDLSSAIESLKTSLPSVLVKFYPLAGRLTLGEDRRLVIDNNDLGVEFVEASMDLPISELEEDGFQMKVFFEDLCQVLETWSEHLYTSPLLSVQATRFSDGGLVVAVAMNQIVADGQSLWHFLVSWGECARGAALSLEPLHERERLAVQDPSPEKASLYREEGQATGENERSSIIIETDETKDATLEEYLTAELEKVLAETGVERTSQLLFHVSGSSIKKLKSEATASTGKSFSSFVVLCAHFWQRVTIARQRPSSEMTAMLTLVNYRSRLTPPLPPAYFGNVIACSVARSNSATIVQESLGAIASRIQAAITASTEDQLSGLMNWMELHNNELPNDSKFHGKSVNAASSPWFPVYEVDFGWGKPAAVRAVKVLRNGEIVLFGGKPGANPGDVEICTALSTSALRNLLRDDQFVATLLPLASYSTEQFMPQRQ